jgi:hypothetical protein
VSSAIGQDLGNHANRATRKSPDAFGHFATIWQKNKNSIRKVALDVGLNHPQPQGEETEIRTYIPNFPVSRLESASADLEKTQHSFAESLKDDEADAITDNASNDIRVYRSGNSRRWGRELPKNYFPNRMQKQRGHHKGPLQVTRLISHMNTVITPASTTKPRNMASIFVSGSSSLMAPGK